MNDQLTQIKGTSQGLVITLSEGNYDAVISSLEDRLTSMASFVKGGRVALSVGEREITKENIETIGQLLEQHSVTLWALVSENEITQALATQLGLATDLGPTVRKAIKPQTKPNAEQVKEVPTETEEVFVPSTQAIILRGTLRSGQIVQHHGSVILFGDVNPGAEIIASGDVLVWGRLRGIVHAGAMGDSNAKVCALMLHPTQLRIGNAIGRAPDASTRGLRLNLRPNRSGPEVAHVVDEKIVIEPWNQVKN